MRALAIGMLAFWLAGSVVPPSAMAVDAPPASPRPPTSPTTQFANQLAGRIITLSARQYTEERLNIALDVDPDSTRLLPIGSPARVAFLEEAIRRTQQLAAVQVRPLFPALVSALDANMTPAQISAAAHLFATPTGKRILDTVVSEAILSQGDDSAEMTDEEAQSLISAADVPALIAIEKSGALEAMNKAMDTLPESEDDLATKMESDVDALLRNMLIILKTPSEATTIATSAHPVL